jgi:hypothetical protein
MTVISSSLGSSATPADTPPANEPVPQRWLFSRSVDLAAFLGSAAAALALVGVGWHLGLLHSETPQWTWIAGVLLVDVAHVYATAFRVYFDPAEIGRRPWLYLLTPLLAFAAGRVLYSAGADVFWRTLAYLAVFHFVRQQYGWVALYRAKCGERGRLGWWIDAAAIYLATLYPLAWWHAHLPRAFWWFRAGDFAEAPQLLAEALRPIYWTALALYAARSLARGLRHGFWNPGKDVVVATTAACWYLGIVALDSDFAFTVTNVLIHGVPYFVLIYWHRWERPQNADLRSSARLRHAVMFAATVWALAYAEELLWDRGVWHERAWLFGPAWSAGDWEGFLVPLLAVPQVTHYVLDGFLWRRRGNPRLA